MKIRPVILCGGAGTRLWPKSKKNLAKQFINWGGWTLFDKTLLRVKSSIFDYPIITTNSAYLRLVKHHLIKNRIKKYKIILEPFKKNTAPAILSSILIKEIPEKQPIIFITSDNIIKKNNLFNKSINLQKKYLTQDNISIFGIKPKSPSSEYGYFLTKKVSKNINKVVKFIEKPNKSKVKLILKKKGFMNGGMFFARKDSLIRNFKKYQKEMFLHCFNAVKKAKVKKNIYYLNKLSFKKVQEISFDYAILEKSKNINGIKMVSPFIDMGNWKEIWNFFKKEKSKKDIKKNTFYRPWGKYINLYEGKGFLLKELIINAKSAISLQKHFHRSERWTIIKGRPKITIDKKKLFKKENQSILIPKGSTHRIENIYNNPVQIVEVQMGSILKESDIVRYKDIYGRVN
jgi:mannose-1-phosphate guanylyltransferase/mannose-6-phosphate isomerase